jgi:hypothetical protein
MLVHRTLVETVANKRMQYSRCTRHFGDILQTEHFRKIPWSCASGLQGDTAVLADAQGAMLVLQRVRDRVGQEPWEVACTQRAENIEAALRDVCRKELEDKSLEGFDARERLAEVEKDGYHQRESINMPARKICVQQCDEDEEDGGTATDERKNSRHRGMHEARNTPVKQDSSRQCANVECKAPHNRFVRVPIWSRAGGQDWSEFEGSNLCHRCYERYRLHGNFDACMHTEFSSESFKCDNSSENIRCANDKCPGTSFFLRHETVYEHCTAGDRDWSRFGGKRLCNACYHVYLRQGSFDREDTEQDSVRQATDEEEEAKPLLDTCVEHEDDDEERHACGHSGGKGRRLGSGESDTCTAVGGNKQRSKASSQREPHFPDQHDGRAEGLQTDTCTDVDEHKENFKALSQGEPQSLDQHDGHAECLQTESEQDLEAVGHREKSDAFKQCANVMCKDTNRFLMRVGMRCKVGGQDWAEYRGKDLCSRCYDEYRKLGTFDTSRCMSGSDQDHSTEPVNASQGSNKHTMGTSHSKPVECPGKRSEAAEDRDLRAEKVSQGVINTSGGKTVQDKNEANGAHQVLQSGAVTSEGDGHETISPEMQTTEGPSKDGLEELSPEQLMRLHVEGLVEKNNISGTGTSEGDRHGNVSAEMQTTEGPSKDGLEELSLEQLVRLHVEGLVGKNNISGIFTSGKLEILLR